MADVDGTLGPMDRPALERAAHLAVRLAPGECGTARYTGRKNVMLPIVFGESGVGVDGRRRALPPAGIGFRDRVDGGIQAQRSKIEEIVSVILTVTSVSVTVTVVGDSTISTVYSLNELPQVEL